MNITWYGEGCFKIVESGITLLVDPFEKETGLSVPRFKADILLKTVLKTPTQDEPKPLGGVQENIHLVTGPGQYEISGIKVNGWPLLKSSTENELHSAFKVITADLRLGFLGHLTNVGDPEIVEEFGDIDILFIPAGGDPYIDPSDAAKLIRQIGPRAVIPTFFQTQGLKRQAGELKDFLKEIGNVGEKPTTKLSIKAKDLTEKMQVFVLDIE